MAYIRTKPTQKEVDDSFTALDILSGRKQPEQVTLADYEAYRADKLKLEGMALTEREYDRKIKAIAARHNV